MKKTILLLLASFILTFPATCQITFDTSIPATNISLIKLPVSGYKYKQYSAGVITLYNLNNSVFRTITIPTQSVSPNSVGYVTEHLFDTDDSLEYAVYYLTSSSPPTKGFFYVYNSDGTTLFYKDSVSLTQPISVTTPNALDNVQMIYFANSVVKLKLNMENNTSLIYNLPGELPCNDCTNGGVTSIITNHSNNVNTERIMNYPNPASELTTITYSLTQGSTTADLVFYNVTGQEVKRFKVTNAFHEIIISTADLDAGTYYYQMQTADGFKAGKKMVVVK